MLRIEFDSGKGFRNYLGGGELDKYIECSRKTSKKDDMNTRVHTGVLLAAKSGLRVSEIAKVRNKHRIKTDDRGWMLQVRGKGNKYRETVLPSELALADFEKTTKDLTRVTFKRWADRVNQEYLKTYGDEDILGVTFHDLRRSFITRMIESGANPKWVMKLSGHTSTDVFYKHYVNVGSVEFQAKERSKIEWIN